MPFIAPRKKQRFATSPYGVRCTAESQGAPLANIICCCLGSADPAALLGKRLHASMNPVCCDVVYVRESIYARVTARSSTWGRVPYAGPDPPSLEPTT